PPIADRIKTQARSILDMGGPHSPSRELNIPTFCTGLRQQLMSNLPGHIGQSEIRAMEPKGQLGVVDAKQVQDSGLQVMDVYPVFGDVKSEFVCLANGL